MPGRLVFWFAAANILLLLQACAGVSDDRPEVVRESERYLERGVAAFRDDDYVTAASLFSKALLHYRSFDDAEGVLLSHINLAETALALGNHRAAGKQLALAEQVIHREASLAEHGSRVTLLRATSAVEQGNAELAMELLAPLLPGFGADGRPLSPAMPTALAALVLRTRLALLEADAPELWVGRLQRSLDGLSGEPDPAQSARLKRFQAQLAASERRWGAAHALYREALASYRELAARRGIAQTLEEWAALYMAQEEWEAARDRLQRALFVRSWYHDRRGVARILDGQEKAYAQLGDSQRAAACRHWASSLRGDLPIDWVRVRQDVGVSLE